MSRKAAAKALLEAKKKGRGGDTDIVHVNPKEKAALKAMGGAGTVNPETGLEEYWSWGDDWVTRGISEVGGWIADLPNPLSYRAGHSAIAEYPMSEEDRAEKEASAAMEKELYERQMAGYQRLEDVYQKAPGLAEQEAEFSAEEAQRAQSEVLAAQVGGGLRGGGAAAGARAAAAQAAIDSAGIRMKGIGLGQSAQIDAARAQVEAAAAQERMGTPSQREESKMADAELKVAQLRSRYAESEFGGLGEDEVIAGIKELMAQEIDQNIKAYYQREINRLEDENLVDF